MKRGSKITTADRNSVNPTQAVVFFLPQWELEGPQKSYLIKPGLSFRHIQGDFLSWMIPGATNEDMQEATVRGSRERARGADVAELVARQCDDSPEVSMVEV